MFVSWCFKPSQPQRITSGLIQSINTIRSFKKERKKKNVFLVPCPHPHSDLPFHLRHYQRTPSIRTYCLLEKWSASKICTLFCTVWFKKTFFLVFFVHFDFFSPERRQSTLFQFLFFFFFFFDNLSRLQLFSCLALVPRLDPHPHLPFHFLHYHCNCSTCLLKKESTSRMCTLFCVFLCEKKGVSLNLLCVSIFSENVDSQLCFRFFNNLLRLQLFAHFFPYLFISLIIIVSVVLVCLLACKRVLRRRYAFSD